MLNTSTHKAQSNLAEYCRTEVLQDIPGLTEGRIQQYRRLIFNIILDTLSNAYPISLKLLGKEKWRNIVHHFFSTYACSEPQVWKMPLDFLKWFDQTELHEKDIYPFLANLIYFEWIELELYMMEDIASENLSNNGDFFKDNLVLNPESKILLLDYPVHTKNPTTITKKDKGNYYCLAYREPKDCKVKFIDLSSINAFVIEQLYKDLTLDNIIQQIAQQTSLDLLEIKKQIEPFITHIFTEKFILGFKIS